MERDISRKISRRRVLAVNRGEKKKVLSQKFDLDPTRERNGNVEKRKYPERELVFDGVGFYE